MSPETENKKKLESFFKDEYTSLKAFVGSRLHASVNRDPEDIVQEVALSLFSGVDSYAPISNVAGFVYRSIKNKIIDVMRKGREEVKELNDNDLRWMEFVELMYGKSDNAYSAEMIEALKNGIKELPPLDQTIIIAIDFEGFKYHEISEMTNTPEGTLMSRRHRAISKLYNKLKDKKLISN